MENPFGKVLKEGLARIARSDSRSTLTIMSLLAEMNTAIGEVAPQRATLSYANVHPKATFLVELVRELEWITPRHPHGVPKRRQQRDTLFEIQYGYHTEHDEVTLRFHGEELRVNINQLVTAFCDILKHPRTIAMIHEATTND